MPSLSDFGLSNQQRVTSRNAEKIATAQNQTFQQNLVNQQAGIGTGVPAVTIPGQQAALSAATPLAGQPQVQTIYNMNQPSGVIDQSAIDRLRASGLNEETIHQMLSEKSGIQQAFNQVGTGTAQTVAGQNLQANASARATERANTPGLVDTSTLVQGNGFNGRGTESDAEFAQRKAAVEQQNNAILQRQQMQQDKERANANRNAFANAVSGANTPNTNANGPQNAAVEQTPQQVANSSAMEAYISTLPPEQQQAARMMMSGLSAYDQGINAQGTLYGKSMASAEDLYNKQEGALGTLLSAYKDNKDSMQTVLDQTKQDQEESLSKQQASADAQLAWNMAKQEREMRVAEQKMVDQKIGDLALRGGFGSDGGMKEIETSKYEYERAISDMQTEMGFKRADLAIKFTDLHNQVLSQYKLDSLNNIKDFNAELEKLTFQSLSNMKAKNDAEQSALEKMVTNQTNLRTQAAEKLAGFVKEIGVQVNASRDDKRAQEQLGWQRLQWVATTYGSDAPQELLDSIGKQLPGVDVRSVAGQMTLAESKKKGSGGGGGGGGLGISFAYSEMKPNGAPPTFEDFLRNKEMSALASGAAKFDTSAKAMAEYRKEYETKSSTFSKYSSDTILNLMRDRTKNITVKFQKENIENTVNSYLKAGQNQLAFEYVDGLGTTASSAERLSFSKAATAKQNVNRLASLIEDLGAMGPGIGQVRSMNPYDDRVVEFNNLIRQTVPGMARGIFGEVGVLTDQDIKNYTSTMANPSLTRDQAMTATKNLLKTINLSTENQLNIARAAGVNTRDIRPIFSNIPDYEFGSGSQAQNDPNRAFVDSILSGK